MSNLSAFLAKNALRVDNIKFVASKRFVGEDGKPIEWEISCITSTDDEALRKACTKRVQIPGKRNQYTQDTDFNLYLGKLAAKCTVYPNLDDAELQNSYGVMGSDVLLKTMLTPGEYTDYLTKIQEVNGFDSAMEDEVEEAKN
ncbi:MAG: phage portal protein [Bacillota bacterium]|nr:phage portal protein [Bacillota bacterium]